MSQILTALKISYIGAYRIAKGQNKVLTNRFRPRNLISIWLKYAVSIQT